jgi:hypothetical protein
MSLRIDEIITLTEYLEDFVDAKLQSCGLRVNQAKVNRTRTALVDYIEELIGEKRINDA